MAKKRYGNWRGFKRVSGSHIGKIAVKTYVCGGCGVKLEAWDGNKKPGQCKHCGRLDIITFDSTGEHERYAILQLLQSQKIIFNLQRQVRIDLMAARNVRGNTIAVKVGQYVADFTYEQDGKLVIEDFKGGAIDPLASWKIRHMEAQGLSVKLTKGN